MLTRIYGTAWETPAQLKAYKKVCDARARTHTHTHTHMHTNTHAYQHMRARINTHARSHMHSCAWAHLTPAREVRGGYVA